MKDFKFRVEVTETYKKIYEVSAENAHEAISCIHDKFSERKPDAEYVLGSDDFIEREIGLYQEDLSHKTKNLSSKEKIYYQLLRENHMKECLKRLETALGNSYLAKMVEEEDLNTMAERFEDEHDCSISDNENWLNAIHSVFEGTFFNHNEFNGKPKAALIEESSGKNKNLREAYFAHLKKNNVYVLRLSDNLFIYDDSKDEDVLNRTTEFGIILYSMPFDFKALHLHTLEDRALHLIKSHYHLGESNSTK